MLNAEVKAECAAETIAKSTRVDFASAVRPSFSIRIQHSALLLLFLALCPYFIDLDGSSIWDANEAFYVETPREMMERGDYVNPTFNYEPRINKPVLSYWIVAGFYQAVRRLASACSGSRSRSAASC